MEQALDSGGADPNQFYINFRNNCAAKDVEFLDEFTNHIRTNTN